ncbi:MAG: hypothetical protein Q4D82_05605, partial [Neisseria sp.]|nr:hypothetical protein [Neisseria sp.]
MGKENRYCQDGLRITGFKELKRAKSTAAENLLGEAVFQQKGLQFAALFSDGLYFRKRKALPRTSSELMLIPSAAIH